MPERNPFEETRQAAQDWSPREQSSRNYDYDPSTYTQLSNRLDENIRYRGSEGDSWLRDYWTARNPNTNQKMTESLVYHGPDMISNRFVEPSGQWKDYATGEEGQLKGPQTWDYDPSSGGMMSLTNSPGVNRIKSIYNQIDPFLPNIDMDDQTFGYDFNFPLLGGDWRFDVERDIEDDEWGAGITGTWDL